MMIQCKRVYEQAAPEDGYRVLVDRLWPRGVKKADLVHDEWCKALTPSDGLRKAFHSETIVDSRTGNRTDSSIHTWSISSRC